MNQKLSFFRRLGVFGFDKVEPLILAALVSGDPILLIGKAGTGKTFLLNSISEAMGLEHRHYNASFISFDDLVGFPYPSENRETVSFLQTPATIWGAESVLIDEISRCKPETQNKFFSIINERKVQGLGLTGLRYRWAAMNPFTSTGDEEDYEGSQPLDQALADRFAFIIEVPDWSELTLKDQAAVIHPSGEGAFSADEGALSRFVERLKPLFSEEIKAPSATVVRYVRYAATLMTDAGYRTSPRRARLLARNVIALSVVLRETGTELTEKAWKHLLKLTLTWSLPHRAWRSAPPTHAIDSVHAEAARLVFEVSPPEQWISEFLMKPSLHARVHMLPNPDIDTDTRSLAVMQLLARESSTRRAIFAFSLFPLLAGTSWLNEEAIQELSRHAREVLNVEGILEWKEDIVAHDTMHPGWSACAQVVANLPSLEPGRKRRAEQLFLHLLTRRVPIPEPVMVELELDNCFIAARTVAAQFQTAGHE